MLNFVKWTVVITILFNTSTMILTTASADGVKKRFGQTITVYKTPTCGCCKHWVSYLKKDGFTVLTHDLNDLEPVKAANGLSDPRLKSCHTAVVDGYVIEGHVPADDIWRLLSERPPIIGLSAPGMPRMSPGMASTTPKDYDVLSFDAEGQIRIYSRY